MLKRAALSVLLLLVLASCNSQDKQDQSGASAEDPASQSISEGTGSKIPEDVPVPADAAMYRGKIVSVELSGDSARVTLRQVEGTDFGQPELLVIVDSDTGYGFALDDMIKGDYLEVYYGVSSDGEQEDPVHAIAANLLPDAEISVFNGELKELLSEGMLLTALDSGEEILFRYDGLTAVYLNVDDLQPGDAINIFYSGITTDSIPPEAFAMEIRRYAAPKN